jgi:hypothetical protein
MQFCCVTAAIVTGAIAERGRLVPMLVFIFFWATLVYCPIAYCKRSSHLNMSYLITNDGIGRGMESIRLGIQIRGVGLRGRRACRNMLWCIRPRLLLHARASPDQIAHQLPPAQRLARRPWYDNPVVRLARLQWR